MPSSDATDWRELPASPRSGSIPPPSSALAPHATATHATPTHATPTHATPTHATPTHATPTNATETTRDNPDAAVRARLNAAILDGIMAGLIVGVTVGVLGAARSSRDATLLIVAVQFLYFFVLEVATGQTIGKRLMNIRVVALDGSPATMRMCAIRNAFRFIDMLPLWYASGLLSLMRTGRSRRQRIGDVVAGTTVLVDGGDRLLKTPRWLLPSCALVATLVSLAWIAALAAKAHSSVPTPAVAPGFAGDNSEAPASGTWEAVGTVTSSRGYTGNTTGQHLLRLWRVTHACDAQACGLWLTRQVAGGPPLSALLIRQADGWHATFSDRVYGCGPGGGQTLAGTGILQSVWVLRFADHGTTARAHERNVYGPAAGCGTGTDTLDWTATLTPTR